MNDLSEKVKKHLADHRRQYLIGTSAVIIAGITCLIVRTKLNAKAGIPDTLAVQKPEYPTHGFSFSNSGIINGNVVNVIEREGRGHPGYLVKCLEDGLTYNSQAEAAQALDLSASAISKHLNGKTPHVEGLHFERIFMAN